MVAEQKRMEYEKGPSERDKMEAQIRIPQQRSAMRYSNVKVGGEKGMIGCSLWLKDRPARRM